ARQARHRAREGRQPHHAARPRARAAERRRSFARHDQGDRSRHRGSAARGRAARDVRQVARGVTVSFTRVVKAMPTLLRVGVAETVAYRAEFIVWVLTTTQPLIMMSLMTFITREQ